MTSWALLLHVNKKKVVKRRQICLWTLIISLMKLCWHSCPGKLEGRQILVVDAATRKTKVWTSKNKRARRSSHILPVFYLSELCKSSYCHQVRQLYLSVRDNHTVDMLQLAESTRCKLVSLPTLNTKDKHIESIRDRRDSDLTVITCWP